VTAGRVTDEIMQITDCFTTLPVAGADAPSDREIDGVDQLDRIAGKQPASLREGYLYWLATSSTEPSGTTSRDWSGDYGSTASR
jgi:hypothetical protein